MKERLEGEKIQARQHRDWLHELHERDMGMLQMVIGVLQKIYSFCTTKKNMFRHIWNSIGEALRKLDILREYMVFRKKKTKMEAKKPERSRRARPEAVIVKPMEGVSYAAILKNLKSSYLRFKRSLIEPGRPL